MAGGLYSPSAGDVLTAANAIDYWSKQVVIICTSGTRPASPRSGMTIWQTDTLTFAVYGTAWCETTPYSANVATSETTTSTSYTDLATSGPSVTVTTGTKALITISVNLTGSTILNASASFAISGATTLASADANSIKYDVVNAANTVSVSRSRIYSSLTAGAQTVKVQYKTNTGTLTAQHRDIAMVGIPT